VPPPPQPASSAATAVAATSAVPRRSRTAMRGNCRRPGGRRVRRAADPSAGRSAGSR
jgi:hypothetical protein